MSLIEKIESAGAAGSLLESTVANLKIWASADFLPEWVGASIAELVEKEEWDELNDRFYQNMAFGTGGIRGRTIGKVPAAAETGTLSAQGTPEHAAVGTNVLNDFNLIRATVGMFRYVEKYLKESGRHDLPRFVIAHDVRHFSRHFCELAASTWCKLGGQALIFEGPRSTPQLSFAVRQFKATCGAVITASHNPPHDNGFKAYFEDGAQVVSPHAEGIVNLVNEVKLEELTQFLDVDLTPVIVLGAEADQPYQDLLQEMVVDTEVMQKVAPKVVFTPIHGCGAISSLPALEKLGVEVIGVPEQMEPDGRFPTVKSPNPENAEALTMAIAKANETGADVVIATDPDADRMGVAVRDRSGEMVLLTGNQIGTLMAEYRISTLKDAEILPEDGSENAVLIKTFVTSPMQEAVATWHGLKTINTLTGFKWLGEKLAGYEAEMKAKLLEKEGLAVDYDACDVWTRADLMLDYSTYFVFGGEESYGYLATDKLRDKDANAAVVMFCELAAYLKAQEMTFPEYLDALYLQHGYYEEKTINIYYEGAAGSQKIKNILESYRSNPPKAFGDVTVSGFTDFGQDEIIDADGKRIPPQDFYFLELSNGYSFAVRGSGTEPKIKFYVFGRSDVIEPEDLPQVKADASEVMQAMLAAIDADARERAEA
ncbi:phospho-sugar mutase [Coraliomargarita sp. SDUM461003]|uniref:Phospho-sugar mutase n=1 Tax=Thalassobacterium maritimum TaxID=3041265 RepID=A0ABU1APG3_9BACT|nr:phospho-sugar mutase [Coraliomargarita sp. SDUM461003]MDQ8206069.1 phospho-sugar mutase [Coraliomargarita sp. SDUM461003]